MKDDMFDGLRAVKNAIEDQIIMRGAGSYQITAALHLRANLVSKYKWRIKLGINEFAEALLVVPKTHDEISSCDAPDVLLNLVKER